MPETSSEHRWRFFRMGGFDQVLLENPEDFLHLDQLDPKLWTALSCPTTGIVFDPRTLRHLDADGDGRIRVPEVKAAVKWVCSLLRDPAELKRGAALLPLASMDDSSPEGREILASAAHILKSLGKPDATGITPEDTADMDRVFSTTVFNGDGVIPEDAVDRQDLKAVFRDILALAGPVPDRSGKPGISEESLTRFFDEARAFAAWWDETDARPAILPLGERTVTAAAALDAVKTKVNDHFTRCRLAAFDPKASVSLGPDADAYRALSLQALSPDSPELRGFPLAAIGAEAVLPLREGVNPAWADAVEALRAEVVVPFLGEKEGLTAGEWADLVRRFADYEAWMAAKKGTLVESLGIQRVRELLSDGSQEALLDLIARDKALAPESRAVASVDKLVLLYRDLFVFLNNFVSFRDFYDPRKQAVFKAGTLYLDQRSFELCVSVPDAEKHAAIAQRGGTYLLYCECLRRGGQEKTTIAAAVTAGDSDNLMVGRNGVFYDRNGQDWDARVVKIVEHPISIREAFGSPYRRIARMVSEQVEKMAQARDRAVQEKAAAKITEASKTPAPAALPAKPGAPPPPPFDAGKFAGIFAAIGLALGAIGTAIASVVTGFFNLAWWQMPLAVVGLVALISGPSMIMAYLKLRKRNLAPILDANGWAVNTKARMNIPFGTALTSVAALPPGAERSLKDIYAEKKTPWSLYVLLLLLVLAAALFLALRAGFLG